MPRSFNDPSKPKHSALKRGNLNQTGVKKPPRTVQWSSDTIFHQCKQLTKQGAPPGGYVVKSVDIDFEAAGMMIVPWTEPSSDSEKESSKCRRGKKKDSKAKKQKKTVAKNIPTSSDTPALKLLYRYKRLDDEITRQVHNTIDSPFNSDTRCIQIFSATKAGFNTKNGTTDN